MLLFFFGVISCKSQVYPLIYEWENAPSGSYFKDINNELQYFVGTWKATYGGKELIIVFNKELEKPFQLLGKTYKKDELVGRYEIVLNNQLIVKSTLNESFLINKNHKITSWVANPAVGEFIFLYNGGDCAVGTGVITMNKINNTEFKWNYKPQTATLNDINCPPPIDSNIYLPITENLVFTKQ